MMVINLKRLAAAAVATGALALAGASSAQAVSLNVGTQATPVGSGTMNFTASAGASRLVVNGSVPLNCTTTGANATIDTGVFTLPATVGVVQPTFSGCKGPSNFDFTVACAESASLVVSGDPNAGPDTWDGYLETIDCTVTFTALGCSADITGQVDGSYTNPSGATAAELTVFEAGQSLTVSNSTCPPAILPNGSGQYGAPGSGGSLDVDDLTYILSGSGTGHPFLS